MQVFLDPAILFFVLGVLAASVKSNLEIPSAISRFLSLYLLMALGLKGGFALAHSGFTREVATSLGSAIALAVVIPLIGYAVLRRYLSGFDAAAVAATYGSVSAVTFVTAVQYLDNNSIAFGGYMAAAMALMESPAIILAVFFANSHRQKQSARSNLQIHNGVTVLIGSLQDRAIHLKKYCMNLSRMVPNCCCSVPCWLVLFPERQARLRCNLFREIYSKACSHFSCWIWV